MNQESCERPQPLTVCYWRQTDPMVLEEFMQVYVELALDHFNLLRLGSLAKPHLQHPHLTPSETWEHLFAPAHDPHRIEPVRTGEGAPSFIPSRRPAYQEILRVLRENEPATVTLVAVGPQSNLALAAAEDPECFLRVKEVVVMGGAVNEPGNVSCRPMGIYDDICLLCRQVTPTSEFNSYADAVAAARVYALTSPSPSTTVPPSILPPYPPKLSKQLTVRLFPLNITMQHNITRGLFRGTVLPLVEAGSPLAEWVSAFMAHTFRTLEKMHPGHTGDNAELSLHDPVCVWYALTDEDPGWVPSPASPEDIRIETTGQWTRGMCVIDQRNRHRIEDDFESPSDHGLWLSRRAGNRIWNMQKSPVADKFGEILMERLFTS